MSKLKSAIIKPSQQKPKRRTKKVHKDLLEQIEFYFGEANLRHDPFLREKTGDKGTNYVPISLLLSFPKVRELTTEKKDIVTAIKESRIVELNEDESSIHRRLPVPRPPYNLDQSTLYVENLPHDTTIEWLKEVCEKIGTVRYISLPRYRKSGKVKGFAFIEFLSPEEVSRACRVLKDPPTQFFPSRTEKYLLRVKRRKTLEHLKTETPFHEFKTPDTVRSGGSSCLNKSLDSALDLDVHIQQTPTTTHEGRKRRRSHRLSDQGSETVSPGDKLSHTPAKKLKSLPTDSSCQQTSTQPGKSFEQNAGEESCLSGINKNKRKVLFGPIDSSAQTSSTVNNAIANHKSAIRTSDDKFSEQSSCSRKRLRLDSTETESLEIQLKEKYSKKGLNGSTSADGVGLSDSKVDISEPSKKTLSKETEDVENKSEKSALPSSVPPEAANGVTSAMKSSSPATLGSSNQVHKGTATEATFKTSKRKRSISEPPAGYENNTPKLKKIQEMDLDATIGEDTGHSKTDIPVNFDIDAIIAQGRQQAQASMPEHSLQSVVAKPKARKSRQRGRKKKEKPPVPETAPKLNVMSKVDWLKYKQEYRRLQKENMSRLKRILRAGKNAGSVFIKKHLDVLKDGNVSDDSSSSDSDSNNDSTNQPTETKDEKPGKRGPPTFTPGVIAKVSASNPTADNEKATLPNIEEIKSILSKYGRGVAYVDTKPGDASGFVRFYDGDSAQRAILEEKTLALCLLTGELEERYWDKLLASRAQKFARERRKISGRSKILMRADRCIEKAKRRHIRFDNDFSI